MHGIGVGKYILRGVSWEILGLLVEWIRKHLYNIIG